VARIVPEVAVSEKAVDVGGVAVRVAMAGRDGQGQLHRRGLPDASRAQHGDAFAGELESACERSPREDWTPLLDQSLEETERRGAHDPVTIGIDHAWILMQAAAMPPDGLGARM
jgi:hypothetical protein